MPAGRFRHVRPRPVSLDHLRGEPSLAQRSGQRQATKPGFDDQELRAFLPSPR
jgi:hypothetical protein